MWLFMGIKKNINSQKINCKGIYENDGNYEGI